MADLEIQSIEAMADWVETSVLVSHSGHFGRDKLDELARSELRVLPTWVSMALDVMSKRAQILGGSYPFRVSEIAVLRRTTALSSCYATLLCLTPGSVARQTVRASDTAEMGEVLEGIAETALANLWGPGGSAIRFAYPSRHGRPESFDQAIAWLAQRIGLEPGSGYRPPRRKDGGVDVVAWRQFADRRAGFPIALAQCTIQTETFTKTTDIDLRLWASWLAMDVDPMSLLVVPGTIRTAGPDWRQLATVVTVIERLRLMELMGRDGDLGFDSKWGSETLASLADVMKASEL
jgi:hypothetical protein